MSLADRIRTAQQTPNEPNDGCRSCHWLRTVDAETIGLINEWARAGHSRMQLHDILSTPGDDGAENLLKVSYTAWRVHMRHHLERWGADGTQ